MILPQAFRGIALALLLATPATATQRPHPASAPSPSALPSVRRALSCLVSHKVVAETLRDLRLKPGDLATVRYHIGSIPGWGPTPGEFFIAVYDPDDRNAWLLIADPANHGRFLPIGNAYRLRKLRHGWQADEGNGGLATYRTMSDFAARLIRQPAYRLRLTPHPEFCAGPMQ